MMKKCLSLMIAIIIACIGATSFAKSKKAAIKALFNHDMHTEIFTGSNVPCETCHVNDQYEWKKMDRTGCHKCHNAKEPIIPATSTCSMCHSKYKVKPADHKVNWVNEHKPIAQARPDECKACHTDRFCIKCHEERNYILLNMHKRNYKYFHSIDARLDPKKCDRCHTVAYCTACHTSKRMK